MSSISRLRQLLEEFEGTPESRGYDLRLSLADLVLERLSELGWTQRRLAEEAGMKQSFVSRVIHADSNCTFDVAGRILFALGVRAELREVVAGDIVTGVKAVEFQEWVTTALPRLDLSFARSTLKLDEIRYGQEEDITQRFFRFQSSVTGTGVSRHQRLTAHR